MKKEQFPLGRVVCTPGASEKLSRSKIEELLRLHGELNPGTLSAEDVKERELSLCEGLTIHSSFEVTTPGKLPHYSGEIWVITEPDRSVTTVYLRPSEYWRLFVDESETFRTEKASWEV